MKIKLSMPGAAIVREVNDAKANALFRDLAAMLLGGKKAEPITPKADIVTYSPSIVVPEPSEAEKLAYTD